MKKQKKNSAAAGRDRISELPDEILHCILRHMASHGSAARTSAVSRRWRSAWRSYPVVEIDDGDPYIWMGHYQKELEIVGDAEMKRFSRNNVSGMEKLKISVSVPEGTVRSPAIERLLDLASKKNAQEIDIWISLGIPGQAELRLPLPLVTNSKILRLGGVLLAGRSRSLTSLRFLRLIDVAFKHENILIDLISSSTSPLLETLQLLGIAKLRKLRLSNLTNLKTLYINSRPQLEEIVIATPALQNLYLIGMERVSKIEVTALRLRVLEIRSSALSSDKIDRMISRFESLQSLTLSNYYGSDMKKLKLSSPNLEGFELHASPQLEEIELDDGSCLRNLLLYCHRFSPDKLKSCEVKNPSSSCRWEASLSMDLYGYDGDTHPWFVGLESFLASFTQFDTLRVSCSNKVTFRKEEVDLTPSIHPHAIKHLMISTSNCLSSTDQSTLLDGLFWACRPRFLSIFHYKFMDRQGPPRKANRTARDSVCSKLLFQVFLSQHSSEPSTNGKGLNEHDKWQHQLKDVRIMNGNVDEFIMFDKWCSIMKKKETLHILEQEKKDEKEEAIDVSEHVAAYLQNPNQVCFMLTWY